MTGPIITIMTYTVISDSKTDETVFRPLFPPRKKNIRATRLKKVTVSKNNPLFLNGGFAFQQNHSEEGLFCCHMGLTGEILELRNNVNQLCPE